MSKPAATDLGGVKVLVNCCGLRYSSPHTSETIAFDKEIAPGIFKPSTPVSENVAEAYRNAIGTFGVWVYGSQKREMTLTEICGLQTDDPATVEQDMRNISSQNASRVFYDVVRIRRNSIAPYTLSRAVRSELTRAFGSTPSDTFIGDVEMRLGHYLWDREQVRDATPTKVQERIAEVRKQIDALHDAIDHLQDSDWFLIDSAVKRERLKNRHTISGNKMMGLLQLYRRHVAEAEMRIARTKPKGGAKGRMPAYAEEALAVCIADLVQHETGRRPTSTRTRKKEETDGSGRIFPQATEEGPSGRGSIFTQVLTILLSSVSTKPRKNVEALARRALKWSHFEG